MSYFSKEMAQKVADKVADQAEQMIRPKGVDNGFYPNGGGLHIIVGTSEGVILADADVGDRKDWEPRYDALAKDKFNLTVEHKMPTREIQLLYPELAEGKGNTYYWGSWIDGGIIVACSGVDPEWDEAFSKIGCAFIRAMVSKKVKRGALPGVHFRK